MRTECLLVSAGLAWVAACGGSGASGEPLIAGALTGDYQGTAFTPAFGFALERTAGVSYLIAVGTDPIHCGTAEQSDPPAGNFAAIALTSLDVGTYSNVIVEVFTNVGGFAGSGSNAGSVEITASTAESVAGTVTYADTIESRSYGLSGSFEVVRCPS